MNLLKRCIYTTLCTGMLFNIQIASTANAEKPNHWGQSYIRSYLNDNISGYAGRYFTDAEWNAIKKTTVQTNILKKGYIDFNHLGSKATSVYETEDKLFLPSGNISLPACKVISWGDEDISSDLIYQKTHLNTDRLIPMDYFASNGTPNCYCISWLRSADSEIIENSLTAFQSLWNTSNEYNCNFAIAPVLKISLTSITFASSASALQTPKGGISFELSDNNVSLTNYGMYLKKESSFTNFNAKNISYNISEKSKNLVLEYENAIPNQYAIVCAERENKTYCAKEQLKSTSGSIEIDCSNWDLNSLNGLKIQVWMESNSQNEEFASATMPTVFDGDNLKSKTPLTNQSINYTANYKSFSLKKDLTCSWGKITNVLEGQYVGQKNQKIYFGTKSSEPLQFWIAGRENNEGNICADGDTMCLYQSKAVEECSFSTAVPKSNNDCLIDLELQNDLCKSYTGVPVEYFDEYVTSENENKKHLLWRHRKLYTTTWIEGTPISRGTYELQAYLPVNSFHNNIFSEPVIFTVK